MERSCFRSFLRCLFGFVFWWIELATNLVPLLVGIWLFREHQVDFNPVIFAIVCGGVATTIAVAVGLIWSGPDVDKVQTLVDRGAWILMGIVLLVNAIDLTSDTVRSSLGAIGGAVAGLPEKDSHGIKGLTDAHFCLSAFQKYQFTRFDILSLAAGVFTVFLPPILSWQVRTLSASRRLVRTIFGYMACIFILMELMLAFVLMGIPEPAGPADDCLPFHGSTISPGSKDLHEVRYAVVGVAMFLVGYLFNFRSLFQLFPEAVATIAALCCKVDDEQDAEGRDVEDRDADDRGAEGRDVEGRNVEDRDVDTSHAWKSSDRRIWLRTLRSLVFEAVVLPPIIVAAAMVCGQFNPGTAAVFGIFVYSGFSVWNLAAKTVTTPVHAYRLVGLLAVVVQFIFSGLLTVLWFYFFAGIGNLTGTHVHAGDVGFSAYFKPVLQFATAAILVQVVFGTVYLNAWGRSLSDRWFLEGPEFALVATIIVLALGAMPEMGHFYWKLIAVTVMVLIMVFAPALVMRRSLTAYVLIRVLPGKTAHVRKALMAEEVESAAVYGDYDILAKVEVPGRPSLLGESANDSGNLSVLASIIKRVMRQADKGVTSTETLLDFSDFVLLPPGDDEDRTASRATPGGRQK